MNKIHILSSTDRPGSNALKVSEYVKEFIQDFSEAEVFALTEFPFDVVTGGRYGDDIDEVNMFNDRFLDADGFIFVIPEYNGGFPGVLKLFVDYLPFPAALYKKPVSFIGESNGAFGALRSVQQMQQILAYRKAISYPESMYISGVSKNFDRNNGLNSEKLQVLLEEQLKGFIEFVGQLTPEKELS